MTEAVNKTDLTSLLALVDSTYGTERVLAEKGRDVVEPYYSQSGQAFDAALPGTGCMHLAIDPEGEFTPDGYRRQPRAVVKEMTDLGARKVLELGCGKGFNTLIAAKRVPEAQIIGVDLLESHLTSARKAAKVADLANVSYEQADFNALPDSYRDMDVVFAVEALSYATDLDTVARAVAASLRPGGRFVMFDIHALQDIDTLPPELAQATRLYEASVAVTRGFHPAGAWEAALTRAGLKVDPTIDLSRGIQPGLRRMQGMAAALLGDWKKRLAIKAMPKYLVRNGISALLGPHLFRLQKRNQEAGLAYQKITATKPAV